jgi:photosystem II stability/assembly factor-like uncharacterized protein
MFVSTNNGDNWMQSNNGLSDLFVGALTVKRSADVFALLRGLGFGGDAGVCRSTNGGQSWIAVYTNSQWNGSGGALIVHPNGDLYAGIAGYGVFRSTDDGATWNELNSGLGNLLVFALAVDSTKYLYAGTGGGGIFRSSQPVTAVKTGGLPQMYSLSQNYPNPFNPATRIAYSVRGFGFVSLKVFNVIGREIATLVNEEKAPGSYEVTWNASGLASGVYLYRLEAGLPAGQAGSFTATKKLIFIK